MIKFRVYSKVAGGFLYTPDGLNFFWQEKRDVTYFLNESDKFEVHRYIGKSDYTNIDIYENDIVENPSFTGVATYIETNKMFTIDALWNNSIVPLYGVKLWGNVIGYRANGRLHIEENLRQYKLRNNE